MFDAKIAKAFLIVEAYFFLIPLFNLKLINYNFLIFHFSRIRLLGGPDLIFEIFYLGVKNPPIYMFFGFFYLMFYGL